MKTTLLLLTLLISFSGKAQITLEHAYAGNNFTQPILFSSNGEKLMTYDNTQIYLYTMSHASWKTITPSITAGYRIAYVYGVSDNLFNSDNLIEMVVGYTSTSSSVFPRFKSDIIDEHGTVIQSLDTSYSGTIHYNSESNTYKLLTNSITSSASYSTNVYSLPGTMPCGKCGTIGTETVDHAPTGGGMNAYPNPSAGMTVITYDLPIGTSNAIVILYNANGQVVRVYPVNSNSRELIINSNELAPGMYSYSLSGDGIAPVTKKLIIAN